ncbi:hypothetical protein V6N13_004460 [Hibiscus sabdariffa]
MDIDGKKFILVLDNIWNEKSREWDLLRLPLQVGALGNKNPDEYPNLKRIGQEVVRRCNGLPLAITTYASLLHSEEDAEEWNYLADEFCFKFKDVSPLQNPERVLNLSFILGPDHNWNKFAALSRRKVLRTFLPLSSTEKKSLEAFEELFPTENYLRVLSLSMYEVSELPNSICDSKQLRYFDFSDTNIQSLPERVGKLCNLKTLKLSNCIFLFHLLANLSNLIKLEHLYISGMHIKELLDSIAMYGLTKLKHIDIKEKSLEELPYSIGHLENLSYLDISGTDEFCFKFKDVSPLQNPERVLNLSFILGPDHNWNKIAALSRKKVLRTFLPLSSTEKKPLEAFEELFPTENYLHVLSLSMYEVSELPNSICDSKQLRYFDFSDTNIQSLPERVGKLCNLKTLKLSNCIFLFHLLANLSNLIKLEHLYISGMHIKELLDSLVCSLYNLQTLKFSNCPYLVEYPNLKRIGQEVVRRCNGLPLAITTYASLLHSEEDAEGHKFEKRDMVRLWIDEGLVQQPNSRRRLEDVDEFCFKFKDVSPLQNPERVLNLSFILGPDHNWNKFAALSRKKVLRTFLPLSSTEKKPLEAFEELFPTENYLRVLSLSMYEVSELPNSICDSKQLRYFDFSDTNIQSLPERVGKLCNLKTLKLSNCIFLFHLLANLSNLIKLEHLYISGMHIKELLDSLVCSLYNLQTLKFSNCPYLVEYPNLKRIGQEVVRRCNGLPLAITTYASLLHSEEDAEEWNYGHKFEKRDMVRLWIDEGLVQQPNSRRRLEDVDEFCFKFKDVSPLQNPERLLNLSFILGPDHNWNKFTALSRKKVLRTFLPLSSTEKKPLEAFEELFPTENYLRVLSLSMYEVSELPNSICDSKQLRYFDFSDTNIQSLPERVGKLCNLKTLKLSNCIFLFHLLANLSNLIKLEHLYISGMHIKELLDSLVCSLYNLQTLKFSNCPYLVEYPNLKRIGQEVVRRCNGLPSAITIYASLLHSEEDAEEWNYLADEFCFKFKDVSPLQNPKRVLNLSFILGPDHNWNKFAALSRKKVLRTFLPLSSTEKKPLEAFEELFPTENYLRVLSLSMYEVSELPNSICDSKQLRYFDFSDTNIQSLPERVGKLCNLKTLKLSNCIFLFHFLANLSNLIKLEHLYISGMHIKELLDSLVCSLYNLQTLKFSNCPYLVCLPMNMKNLTKLEHLHTKGTPILHMPLKFCNLQCLQLLTDFVAGINSWSSISEIKDFFLRTLSILRLQNVSKTIDVGMANLKVKKYLRELFKWDVSALDDLHAMHAPNV